MAGLPINNVGGLQWQTYTQIADNLICPLPLDFTTYSQYNVAPSGSDNIRGSRRADGVVIDNMTGATPIFVTLGPLGETVPPFTRTYIPIQVQASQIIFNGTTSLATVYFFTGDFAGTRNAVNYYAAQLAAGLAVETGFISMFAGSPASVPLGYLVCDGLAVSRDVYAGLFTKIGTTYGAGDGTTTFNLPNLVDRAPIGAGTIAPLAASVGAAFVTLTNAQVPNHTHNVTDLGHVHTITDPGHNHRASAVGATYGAWGAGGPLTLFPVGGAVNGVDLFNIPTETKVTGITGTNLAGTGLTVQATTGGGGPHSNVQPSVGLTFVIKT
jgi:microcystin-dependent protein